MVDPTDLLSTLLPTGPLAEIRDFVETLVQPLGDGAVPLPKKDRLDLDTAGRSLMIFDQPLDTKGTLSGRAGFLGATADVDPFDTGDLRPLQEGRNSGLLELEAQLGASAEIPVLAGAGGGVQLSAKAGTSANLDYRHYVAAPPTWSQARAFRELILGARLPNLLDLEKPPAHGEVHRLDAKLTLDFGLDLTAGYQAARDISLDLAGDVALPLRTSVAASVQAALGLSLYERMFLAVGRTAQLEDGWIRIRLQRQNERRLGFSATFELDLHDDLGTGLVQLFEEAVDRVPTDRLVEAARRIARYADPATLKSEATGRLAEVLDDLVGEKIVAGLDGVIPFAHEVVSAFDGVEPRVRSLWDRILAKAELAPGAPVRQWLEKLAGLADGGLTIDKLIRDPKARELIQAIETISGRSLESMLLDETGLQAALDEVAKTAKGALDFVDKTPGAVLDRIRAFEEKTGIARTVDVLRNLQSTEQLQTAVSTRIRDLASRIVGKTVDRFLAADLAKVKAWAERIAVLVDPNDPSGKAGALVAKIRTHLSNVRADYGFSVGLEIERVSRRSALLDLELSPAARHAGLRRRVGDALRLGRARDVLRALSDASGLVERSAGSGAPKRDARPSSKSPFLLRECAFASERIRASAVSTMLDLVGLGRLLGGKERGYTRRIEQTAVRIHDRRVDQPGVASDDPSRFVREGRYVAGYQRGERTRDLDTETSIWLVEKVTGTGLDPTAPYTGPSERTLRLAFSWEDDQSSDVELEALFRVLAELGFSAASDAAQDDPRDGQALGTHGRAVRLALEIRFPGSDFETVLQGLGGAAGAKAWNRAFLDAAYRWLAEPFVTRGRVPGDPRNTHDLGQVVSRLLAHSPTVRSALTDGDFFAALGGESVTVDFGSGPRIAFPIGRPTAADATPLTGILATLNRKVRRGRSRLRAIQFAGAPVRAHQRPADYGPWLRAFSDGWRAASVATLRWPNSMFAIWLWIALASTVAPEVLTRATGVATLRWRTEPDGQGDPASDPPWSEPSIWRLDPGAGIPNHLGNAGIFPIP